MQDESTESQTARTLRLMREEWEAPLRAECEQLRVYSEVAADQLRRQNRMASELRAEADRYREALVAIGQEAGDNRIGDLAYEALFPEALNGGTE